MSLVDTRYAEAFVNLAIEKKSLDIYQEELFAVSEIIEKENALKFFLFNPENTLTARKNVLSSIFKDKVEPDILNLLLLLLDKGRITALSGICREYARLADEKKSVLKINIYTAAPIEQRQIDSICEKFKAMYGARQAKAEVATDPSLIGGVKVVIGDKLYDGTIKGKLAKLQSSLAGQ